MKNYTEKLNNLFFVLLVVCSCYSCSTEDIAIVRDPIPSQKDIVKINASISCFKNEYASSTGIVKESEYDNLETVWGENDRIGVFSDSDNQVACSIKTGAGSYIATFVGDIPFLKDTSYYSAYFPLVDQINVDRKRIPISYIGQTQIGNASCKHVSAYDYMVATNSNLVDADSTLTFYFQHLVSVLHLSITMPKAGTYTKLLLESSGNLIKEGSFNLSDGVVTSTKTGSIQELKLDNVTLEKNDLVLEVYIVINPINLTNKTLTVKVFDSLGNIYEIEGTIGGKIFEAGTVYHEARVATLAVESTGLPIVFINTPNNVVITSKHEWLEPLSTIAIITPDGNIDYEANDLAIKGRGNATWNAFPKKPYALKLGSKSDILGMKKHKRWCLLANWMDRTNLRNDIAFYIAKKTRLAWTPDGRFVEVVLNGNHIGNYYLCEQIRVDKNRVNINEMTENDIEGDALTGGYLMELDTYYDEVNKYYSETRHLPYMFKEPDEKTLQPNQFAYMQNFINQLESILYADNWLDNREYVDYMDIGSFIDYWFVYELSTNTEPKHPKSTYMYKDKLGKLFAGPVWDFDNTTFLPAKSNNYSDYTAVYYERLFQDPVFVAEVKTRWQMYKSEFNDVPNYIRSVAEKIKKSCIIDSLMWPLSALPAGANNEDSELSFDEAVERIIDSYKTKLNWLDDRITKM